MPRCTPTGPLVADRLWTGRSAKTRPLFRGGTSGVTSPTALTAVGPRFLPRGASARWKRWTRHSQGRVPGEPVEKLGAQFPGALSSAFSVASRSEATASGAGPMRCVRSLCLRKNSDWRGGGRSSVPPPCPRRAVLMQVGDARTGNVACAILARVPSEARVSSECHLRWRADARRLTREVHPSLPGTMARHGEPPGFDERWAPRPLRGGSAIAIAHGPRGTGDLRVAAAR